MQSFWEGCRGLDNEEDGRKCLLIVGTETFLGGGGETEEVVSVAVCDERRAVCDRPHSEVICTYTMKGMRWVRRRGMKLF